MNDEGKEARFETLLARNRGRWIAIARSYADKDADDLLQEIMLQIWRSLDQFQDRSNVDTWCYRVALNTAFSWRRRKLRHSKPDGDLGPNLDEVEGPACGHDAVDLLNRFLRSLSDIDRAVLLMYLDDMSGAEMAAAIGVEVGAVRVRIHRIKSRLRDWEATSEY